MAGFDDHADLMATLKVRLNRAASRLSKASAGEEMFLARKADAQATYDRVMAEYTKAKEDALAAAKEPG